MESSDGFSAKFLFSLLDAALGPLFGDFCGSTEAKTGTRVTSVEVISVEKFRCTQIVSIQLLREQTAKETLQNKAADLGLWKYIPTRVCYLDRQQ